MGRSGHPRSRRTAQVAANAAAIHRSFDSSTFMRALFLDFDGVLQPAPSGKPRSTSAFCWIPDLKGVLAGHEDVVLVVHSSWREVLSVGEISNLLEELPNACWGVTKGAGRDDSIKAWLAAHPYVLSHRILDDDLAAFGDPAPHELFACHPQQGVSDPRVQALLTQWLERTAYLGEPVKLARGSWVA